MGRASTGDSALGRLGVVGKVAIGAGIVALVGALVIVALANRPAGTPVKRHDDRLRRLEAAVCKSDPDLPATTVVDCRATIDASPEGSGCRYTVEADLQTTASDDQLVRYYTAFPAAEDFGEHLFRPEESAAAETRASPGRATVRVLMIGDALEDPRCA
jgi:hypothetical protein